MSEREEQPTEVGVGYPEDGQPGTGIKPQDHAEEEIAEDAADARERSDGDPGQATGNPKAAGADDEARGG